MVLNMLALEFVLRFDDDVKALLLRSDGKAICEALGNKYQKSFDADPHSGSGSKLKNWMYHLFLSGIGGFIIFICIPLDWMIGVGPFELTERELASCQWPTRRYGGYFGPAIYCYAFDPLGSGQYEFEMRVGHDRAQAAAAVVSLRDHVLTGLYFFIPFFLFLTDLINIERSITHNLTTWLVFVAGTATAIAWAAMLVMSAAMITIGPWCKPGLLLGADL